MLALSFLLVLCLGSLGDVFGKPLGTGITKPHQTETNVGDPAAGTILWKGPSTGFVDAGIARGPNGTFYLVDDDVGSIFQLDGQTGDVVQNAGESSVVGSIVASDKYVYAVEAKAVLLRFELDLSPAGSLTLEHGLLGTDVSTNLILSPDMQHLYVAAHTVAAGSFLHCVDPAAGLMTEVWKQALPRNKQAQGIALSQDSQYVYVFVDDQVLCLRASDGGTKWAQPVPKASNGVLTITGNILYVSAGKTVVALETSLGKEQWSVPVDSNANRGVMAFNDSVVFVPADATLLGLNITNGETVFTSSFKQPISEPAISINNDQIFVAEVSDGEGGSGSLHCLNMTNGGTVVWSITIDNVDGTNELAFTEKGNILIVPADYVLGVQV